MKKFTWGLILLPFGLATFYELPALLFVLRAQVPPLMWLAGGAVAYCAFEVIFSRPMRTYVFGHELTHAIAGLAVGSKIHSFKVSKKGGSVTMSKSNFVIALAPYCVPLYTFGALALYAGLSYFYPLPYLSEGAQFLVGATLAFHVSLTLYAVQQRQPDIHKTGLFFSAIFILMINAWVLVGLAKILFWNDVSLRDFAMRTLRTQNEIWVWSAHRAYEGVMWGFSSLKSLKVPSAH